MAKRDPIDPNYLDSARKAFHDLPGSGTFSNALGVLKKAPEKAILEKEALLYYSDFFQIAPPWHVVGGDPAQPPLQHAPSVEDLLRNCRIPLHSASFIVKGSCVIPRIGTEQRDGYWSMNLDGYDAELRGSPKEKIAAARKVMIDLLTHEVDEWLFKAGRAEDPHESHNELDRNELNRIYEKGAASL